MGTERLCDGLTSLSALCLMDLLKCPEPVKCSRVRGNWLQGTTQMSNLRYCVPKKIILLKQFILFQGLSNQKNKSPGDASMKATHCFFALVHAYTHTHTHPIPFSLPPACRRPDTLTVPRDRCELTDHPSRIPPASPSPAAVQILLCVSVHRGE